MADDAIKPTTETRDPNLSTEHQQHGDARRPSDTLDTPAALASALTSLSAT